MIDTDFERYLDEWQQAQRNTTRPCEAAEEESMEHKRMRRQEVLTAAMVALALAAGIAAVMWCGVTR